MDPTRGMNILEIIEISIKEHNELLNKVAEFTKKQQYQYSLNDYTYWHDYLKDFGYFTIPQFFAYAIQLRDYLYNILSGLSHGAYKAITHHDEVKLYSLTFFCSAYLVQSDTIINLATQPYYHYVDGELFNRTITGLIGGKMHEITDKKR